MDFLCRRAVGVCTYLVALYPLQGLCVGEVHDVLNQVDGVARSIASPTAKSVVFKRQAWVVVAMKGAKALTPNNSESQSVGDIDDIVLLVDHRCVCFEGRRTKVESLKSFVFSRMSFVLLITNYFLKDTVL